MTTNEALQVEVRYTLPLAIWFASVNRLTMRSGPMFFRMGDQRNLMSDYQDAMEAMQAIMAAQVL